MRRSKWRELRDFCANFCAPAGVRATCICVNKFAVGRLHGAVAQGASPRPRPSRHRAWGGCVVLPVSFYENVLKPTLARSNGVVYALPEMRPVRELFGEPAADM